MPENRCHSLNGTNGEQHDRELPFRCYEDAEIRTTTVMTDSFPAHAPSTDSIERPPVSGLTPPEGGTTHPDTPHPDHALHTPAHTHAARTARAPEIPEPADLTYQGSSEDFRSLERPAAGLYYHTQGQMMAPTTQTPLPSYYAAPMQYLSVHGQLAQNLGLSGQGSLQQVQQGYAHGFLAPQHPSLSHGIFNPHQQGFVLPASTLHDFFSVPGNRQHLLTGPFLLPYAPVPQIPIAHSTYHTHQYMSPIVPRNIHTGLSANYEDHFYQQSVEYNQSPGTSDERTPTNNMFHNSPADATALSHDGRIRSSGETSSLQPSGNYREVGVSFSTSHNYSHAMPHLNARKCFCGHEGTDDMIKCSHPSHSGLMWFHKGCAHLSPQQELLHRHGTLKWVCETCYSATSPSLPSNNKASTSQQAVQEPTDAPKQSRQASVQSDPSDVRHKRPRRKLTRRRRESSEEFQPSKVHRKGPAFPVRRTKALSIEASDPKAPGKKRYKGTWTEREEAAAIEIMKQVKTSGIVRRVDDLWPEISRRLETQAGVKRSAAAVKNQWNRFLRAKAGFDERAKPRPDFMQTGLLRPNQRLHINSHGKPKGKNPVVETQDDSSSDELTEPHEDNDEYEDDKVASDDGENDDDAAGDIENDDGNAD